MGIAPTFRPLVVPPLGRPFDRDQGDESALALTVGDPGAAPSPLVAGPPGVWRSADFPVSGSFQTVGRPRQVGGLGWGASQWKGMSGPWAKNVRDNAGAGAAGRHRLFPPYRGAEYPLLRGLVGAELGEDGDGHEEPD